MEAGLYVARYLYRPFLLRDAEWVYLYIITKHIRQWNEGVPAYTACVRFGRVHGPDEWYMGRNIKNSNQSTGSS